MFYTYNLIINRPKATNQLTIMKPTVISYPVAIANHTQLTNLVFQLLAFTGAQPKDLSFNDEPLSHDALDEELLSLLEDGSIDQGFYIYLEQDSDLLQIFTLDEWETNPSEDEDEYTYHTFIATYDDKKLEIILAIN